MPKHKRKAPIHHATSSRMFSESCTSAGESPIQRTTAVPTRAMTSKAEPEAALESEERVGDSHCSRIKATLIGRMSKTCVYCSSCNANANHPPSGLHQRATATALRMKKTRRGEDLRIDFEFGLVANVVSGPLSLSVEALRSR